MYTTAEITPSRRHRTWLRGGIVAVALAACLAVLAPASPASAAVGPAPLNTAQCDPNTGVITQGVDLYRTQNETVYFRGVLERNGQYFYSGWTLDVAGVQGIKWTAARGEYRVWVQYGVYNYTTRAYTYAQYKVTNLTTLGRLDGYSYIGGSTGRCAI